MADSISESQIVVDHSNIDPVKSDHKAVAGGRYASLKSCAISQKTSMNSYYATRVIAYGPTLQRGGTTSPGTIQGH